MKNTDEHNSDWLSSQATEVLIYILNRLDIYDLFSIRSVNQTFYALMDDPRFYNNWYPSNKDHSSLLRLSKIKHQYKGFGFSYFFLWFHKYVLYRYNCIRHNYGMMNMDLMNIDLMTVYNTYEYLDSLSQHDDSPENYIQTVTELLIGFDIATPFEYADTTLWELIYGYIKIH